MKTWTHSWNVPMQRRVSLLTTAAVALTVVLFSALSYVALSATMHRSSQAFGLRIAAELSGPAIRDITTTGGLSAQLQQPAGVVVEAVDGQGRVLRTPGQQQDLVLRPDDREAVDPAGTTIRRTGRSGDGQPFSIVAVPLPGTGYALVVGRPLTGVDEILATQRVILVGISGAGVLAAALAGILVGLSGLRSIRRLTDAVEHVTAMKDYHPIPVDDARGDLAVLAMSFNQMLASLSETRNRQSRLVADASHELRTPLTSLSTNVDLLSNDLRVDHLSLVEKSALLSDVSGQLVGLTALVNDLLQLSGEGSARTTGPLDLRDVVGSAVERVRPRRQDLVFDVELEPLEVTADAVVLERAVTNLLDNAVKWSPPGGTVRVRLKGNELRVSDGGPGIPEADLPYVFDRFFRGESGRQTPGTGLGLAIVAKAVDDLGGAVEAGRSAEGGAELTLHLPGVTNREVLPGLLIPVG